MLVLHPFTHLRLPSTSSLCCTFTVIFTLSILITTMSVHGFRVVRLSFSVGVLSRLYSTSVHSMTVFSKRINPESVTMTVKTMLAVFGALTTVSVLKHAAPCTCTLACGRRWLDAARAASQTKTSSQMIKHHDNGWCSVSDRSDGSHISCCHYHWSVLYINRLKWWWGGILLRRHNERLLFELMLIYWG